MGVSLEKFKLREANLASSHNGNVRFAFVGHVDYRKGADVLRKAAEALTSRNAPCELSVYGNYTSDIRFSGLSNVKSHGWIPQEQLAAELTKHDVLVLPSRHDSFGMVVAEAMACGLPVIVSDHVGAKEMVVPQANGLIVAADDPAALIRAMSWFIDHREQIPEMIPAARAAAERYSWPAYRQRAVELLRQIASQPVELVR
jgi:glycosyltransferase involved in cell wall biosynthesis